MGNLSQGTYKGEFHLFSRWSGLERMMMMMSGKEFWAPLFSQVLSAKEVEVKYLLMSEGVHLPVRLAAVPPRNVGPVAQFQPSLRAGKKCQRLHERGGRESYWEVPQRGWRFVHVVRSALIMHQRTAGHKRRC